MTQPVDSVVLVGGNASFSCSAYGTTPITVTWYRSNPGSGDSSAVPVLDRVTENVVGSSTEVTVTSTLTLPGGVDISDDGSVFYCSIQNNLTEAGVFRNESDSATLTVQCTLVKIKLCEISLDAPKVGANVTTHT